MIAGKIKCVKSVEIFDDNTTTVFVKIMVNDTYQDLLVLGSNAFSISKHSL
jgi:hypothetical protein